MPLPSENSISGLSDELLQEILVRLGSARAAAGTSVLSRRWRHVWADVPKLILDGGPNAPPSSPPASFLDVALDAHAAPTVQRLPIAVSDAYADAITSGRAASWLCFAAKRVAGMLFLLVPQGFLLLAPTLLPYGHLHRLYWTDE